MNEGDRKFLIKFSTDMSERMAKVETAVAGNGTAGLGERMDNAEGWQKDHLENHAPKAPSRSIILAQRLLEVTAMGVIIAGLTLVFKLVGWL